MKNKIPSIPWQELQGKVVSSEEWEAKDWDLDWRMILEIVSVYFLYKIFQVQTAVRFFIYVSNNPETPYNLSCMLALLVIHSMKLIWISNSNNELALVYWSISETYFNSTQLGN